MILLLSAAAALAHGAPPDPARAEALYARTCALCHGADRQGYAADHAPSLRSPELWATASPAFLWAAVAFGRPGTAMAAFLDEQGGPLSHDDLHLLLAWLEERAAAPRRTVPDAPVHGDARLGAALYARHCASCHGARGEGGTGTALGNPVFLATASDAWLREAIRAGRSGTPMAAWGERLRPEELDALTAFPRSRATGWTVPEPVRVHPPDPGRAILHPDAPAARFEPREDRFVAAEQVVRALAEGRRMVLLDARPLSDWLRGHLPGALPLPFYDGVEALMPHLTMDGTPIIAYCACPHAASGRVVDELRARGLSSTGILDEGVLVRAARGYPMHLGENP